MAVVTPSDRYFIFDAPAYRNSPAGAYVGIFRPARDVCVEILREDLVQTYIQVRQLRADDSGSLGCSVWTYSMRGLETYYNVKVKYLSPTEFILLHPALAKLWLKQGVV